MPCLLERGVSSLGEQMSWNFRCALRPPRNTPPPAGTGCDSGALLSPPPIPQQDQLMDSEHCLLAEARKVVACAGRTRSPHLRSSLPTPHPARPPFLQYLLSSTSPLFLPPCARSQSTGQPDSRVYADPLPRPSHSKRETPPGNFSGILPSRDPFSCIP